MPFNKRSFFLAATAIELAYCLATVGPNTLVIEPTLLIPHLVEEQGIPSKSLTRHRTSGRRRNDRSHRFAPRRPRGPPSLKPIDRTSVTIVTSRGTSPHLVPNHIALANVANRLSAFMPLPTVTSKKTRSNIRPTAWTTRKTPRPGARLGVARRNEKAYGNKIVAPCLTALRDRRHTWPVHACDAELPPCT